MCPRPRLDLLAPSLNMLAHARLGTLGPDQAGGLSTVKTVLGTLFSALETIRVPVPGDLRFGRFPKFSMATYWQPWSPWQTRRVVGRRVFPSRRVSANGSMLPCRDKFRVKLAARPQGARKVGVFSQWTQTAVNMFRRLAAAKNYAAVPADVNRLDPARRQRETPRARKEITTFRAAARPTG